MQNGLMACNLNNRSKIGTLCRGLAMSFLAFAVVIISSASAQEKPSCPHLLNIDAAYRELKQSEPTELKKRAEVTKLLNEAFTPLLKTLHERFSQVEAEEIAKLAAEVKFAEPKMNSAFLAPLPAYEAFMGYDASFEAIVRLNEYVSYAYNSQNREGLKKLATAMMVVQQLIRKNLSLVNSDPTLLTADLLLRSHTFSRTNIYETLGFAMLSVLQSAAQFTSDPVGDLTTEEILIQSMTQNGERPSLMVMHALMLPPAILGAYGLKTYVKEPLVLSEEGRLSFSPKFRNFLKRHKDEFQQNGDRESNEMGHGCPVAHCAGEDSRSGLQYFLDLILYVYSNLPE